MPSKTKPQAGSPINGSPFRFECPVVAFEKADASADRRRRIGGIISTDSLDQQNERILQEGLDFGYFLDKGWYNDNHKNDSSTDVVGYPEAVKQFGKGEVLPNGKRAEQNCTWTEGYLIGEKGQRIWDIANDLQGTGRTLGFSVEGDINKRTGASGNTIARATIRHIAVTHCHPGDTVVSGPAKAVTRRQYVGEMIDIELVGGHKVSGTPNHPILTDMGWVPLGRIQKGKHRVGRARADVLPTGSSLVNQDKNNVPTSLEEAFQASLRAGTANRRRVVEDDFHGDGRNGHVDIVAVKGQLHDRMQAGFKKHFGDLPLPAADQLQRFLSGPSNFSAMRRGVFSIPPGGLTGKRPFALDLRGQASGASAHFLHVAPSETRLGDEGVHRLSTDPVGAAQLSGGGAGDVSLEDSLPLLHAELPPAALLTGPGNDEASPRPSDAERDCDVSISLASAIQFDHVASKSVRSFDGHVYTIESDVGWFMANGIASHNCPVNADSSLEVLARSMSAMQAEKALTVGVIPEQRSDEDSPDPRPGVTAYGEGAMHVLMPGFGPEAPRRRKKKHRIRARKSLNAAEALDWVRQRIPGIPASTAREFIKTARRLERRGMV